MAAPLALEGVTVEKNGQPVDGGPQVGINLRGDTMRVYRRGTLVLEVNGIAGQQRIDRRNYTVTTNAGDVFHVQVIKDCGCGRR